MMILSTGSLSIFKNFDADIGISRFTMACSFVKKRYPGIETTMENTMYSPKLAEDQDDAGA
jgi:hypothetical protein